MPLLRVPRVPRSVLEKAWLKQQLDALVASGELTVDSLGRYGLPEWSLPNIEVSRAMSAPTPDTKSK